MKMNSERVRVAREFGAFAELKASEEYVKRGYAILERQWRIGKTEIDLIAQSGDVVAFIEVKARSGRDNGAVESVTHDKKKRMMRAADSYIRKLKGDFNYRFDIVALTGNKENYKIEILEDAFLSADIF